MEPTMTKKPAGRSRTNDPAGVRKRVLDATAGAFQSRGYYSTSTHDIVREAGVTGGALHHHFPTKKALGLAVREAFVDTGAVFSTKGGVALRVEER